MRSRLAQLILALVSVAGAVILTLPRHVSAHEIRPAIATVDLSADGMAEIEIGLNLEAAIADIGPEHGSTELSRSAVDYDALRAAPSDALIEAFDVFAPTFLAGIDLRFDQTVAILDIVAVAVPAVGNTSVARTSRIRLTSKVPDPRGLTWRYAFGDSVIRVVDDEQDAPSQSAFVKAGDTSPSISVAQFGGQTALGVFFHYVPVGFDHILPRGLDHILFVVGLFFLATGIRSLLLQVTIFTAAHSVTLALAMTGLVNIPASIVEPLIAASIVFIAWENLFHRRMTHWRLGVIFCFGLLHGLGFAGALSEFGLSPQHFFAGLIGFNAGVELGQLAVIGVCMITVGVWFSGRSWYRQAISVPASLVIGLIASYWTVERLVQ